MQLKLKENPQTASVFQRKELKPKPLKYLSTYLATLLNSHNKIKRADITRMILWFKKSSSLKKKQNKLSRPSLSPGKNILDALKPYAKVSLEARFQGSKWMSTKQNLQSSLRRSGTKRLILRSFYHLKNNRKRFSCLTWTRLSFIPLLISRRNTILKQRYFPL